MNIRDQLNSYEAYFPCLRRMGLTEAEILIYLASLSIGVHQTGGILAKRSSLKRSTAYSAIEHLSQKGLMSFIVKADKRKYHLSEPPKNLATYLEKKKTKLCLLQEEVSEILPKLQRIKSEAGSMLPEVTIFEGAEAVQQVRLKLLNQDAQLHSYFDSSKTEDRALKEFIKTLGRQNKRGKFLIPDTPANRPFRKELNALGHETQSSSIQNFQFESEKHIIGELVAHIIVRPNSCMAILIKDQKIAEAERIFFTQMMTNREPKHKRNTAQA